MKLTATAIGVFKALASSGKLVATVAVQSISATATKTASRITAVTSASTMTAKASVRTISASVYVRGIKAVAVFGAGEAFRHGVLAVDVVRRFFAKGFTESLSALDRFRPSLTKRFQENLTATDDFNGVAADDDSVLRFTKVKADSASAADSVTRLVGFNRTFVESKSAADRQARDFIKRLSDSVTVTDLADVNFKDGGFRLEDLPLITDLVTLAPSKGLASAGLTSDIKRFTVIKALADAAITADQAIKQIQKRSTDAVAASETGYMRWQSYADQSYFAEAYVGSEQTF